jgi:hypothetical protein
MRAADQLIDQVENRLRKINGIEHYLRARDFVIPTELDNSLIIAEREGEADLAICLREKVLERLSSVQLPQDFDFELIPDLSLVVEELSHFNFYCVHAHSGRQISGLDMEIQAEVDKFAFALDCLEQQNQASLEHKLFDLHFEHLKLGGWVSSDLALRYEDAHRIARGFCRKILQRPRASERRALLRDFFRSPSKDRWNQS